MLLLEIPVGSKEFESCAKFNPMKDISLGIGMGNMPKMKLPTLSVLLVITALGFCQTTWAQTNSGQSSTSQVNSGQVNSGPPKVDMTKKIFDPTRDTAKDIADAIKQATKEKKRILLDVGGNWCIWCRRLDLLMETDKQIRDALKQKFVVVKVNFSPENKNESILSKYPAVTGYPHLFVLEKDGKLLHSQDTGLLETGDHHDPAKVMEFLNKWSGK